MAGISGLWGRKVLDWIFGQVVVQPEAYYVRLYKAAPTKDSTLASLAASEVADAGYEGQEYTPTLAEDAGDGYQQVKNSNKITFGKFQTADEEATHFVVATAKTGTVGDIIGFGQLTEARTTHINDTFSFDTNDLKVKLR